MQNYIKTLTIAGSDCSGGAGIQADLKTFMAHGCYGMSVITALTAQNTQGVQAVYPISAEFIRQQLISIFNDICVDAIKMGMLFNEETIIAVAEQLKLHSAIPLILDPVMVAKDNSALLKTSAINALIKYLLPLTWILTPNIPEAELLINNAIIDKSAMENAARQLCALGPRAVLIKGGHLPSTKTCDDYLFIKSENRGYWFSQPRINTKNTHGTGCTLSAAITAFIAQGKSFFEATQLANQYLHEAIQAGANMNLGKGLGPVNHAISTSLNI